MTMKATVVSVDFTGNHYEVQGTIATSGTIPAAGHGDILPFTQALMGASSIPFPNVTGVPDYVEIYEAPAAGSTASGYLYSFSPGTTLANGKCQIFQSAGSAAPLGEVTNTAWSTIAPVNLNFLARFYRKGV